MGSWKKEVIVEEEDMSSGRNKVASGPCKGIVIGKAYMSFKKE
jgi:hypothetical protein